MSVSIPNRWRPQITLGGPGLYRVSWVGMPICTCSTRSDARLIRRHLLALLRPLARSTQLNLGAIAAAIYVWLLAASMPESGILPQVVPGAGVTVPRPLTVQQRVVMRTPLGPEVRATPKEAFNIVEGPSGPELVKVAGPDGPDTSSSGGGSGTFLTPAQAILNDIRRALEDAPPERALWYQLKLVPPRFLP